jgi:LAO/AO transport system kinase
MRQQLRQALLEHAEAQLGPAIEASVLAVARRETDPYRAAEELVAAFARAVAGEG